MLGGLGSLLVGFCVFGVGSSAIFMKERVRCIFGWLYSWVPGVRVSVGACCMCAQSPRVVAVSAAVWVV